MSRPSIQNQKIYQRKISVAAHLLKFFGGRSLANIGADDVEDYRGSRLINGAAIGTIDLEIEVLRAIYNLARKRKKIYADFVPGEFLQIKENNPRRRVSDAEYEKILQHADSDFKDFLIF